MDNQIIPFYFRGLDTVEFSIYNRNMNSPELPEPIDFQWDKGNQSKSLEKHSITIQEAEEAFFGEKLIIPDQHHSEIEQRYDMLGQTNSGKTLYIVFTIRKLQVRIISARRADKKEREIYEKGTKKTT